MTVVAFVILQCIPCILLYECRCMSDAVFVQFVCRFFNLMVIIQIKVCQRFICIVFVDNPHSSNEDHVKLDFLYPCLLRLAISMLCFAFAFLSW